MEQEYINSLGDELHQAWLSRQPVAPLTDRFPTISIADAYQIQQRMIGHRVAAGERHVGKKIGLTARCLLYTSPSPRDGLLPRMPSSA